jgi:Protein of unknown function (DUF1353)
MPTSVPSLLRLVSLAVCLFTISAQSPGASSPSLAPSTSATPARLEPWGHFEGHVDTHRPNKGDPDFDPKWPDWQEVLVQDFSYFDRKGKHWIAHKGDHIDGASIPKVFWGWLIGTPTTGSDFDASVIHDSYCYRKGQNISPGREPQWSEIHRMFYEAMRCSDTGQFEAKIKYWAVRKWGPPANRSIFQRLFGSPDGRTIKTPNRGPAADLVSKFGVLLNDEDVATFFAGMTQSSNANDPKLTEFQISPSAQMVAADKIASELNQLAGASRTDYSGGRFSQGGSSGGSRYAKGQWDVSVQVERNLITPNKLIVAPTYIVARSPEEKEAVEAAIYIAQRADRLSADDLDQLAEKGIPKTSPH